jgi:hypothetical protein
VAYVRFMARAEKATIFAFCCLGVVFVGLGTLGAVVGVPANYGVTPSQALEVLDDRPVQWTAGWIAWSASMTLIAVLRAWWLARRKPWVRYTAVRGLIWLWGAIGATWFYPWAAWDLQVYDVLQDSSPVDGVPLVLSVAIWWWLGSGIALLIGLVWSLAIAFRDMPTAVGEPVSSDAPCKDAPPLLRGAPQSRA